CRSRHEDGPVGIRKDDIVFGHHTLTEFCQDQSIGKRGIKSARPAWNSPVAEHGKGDFVEFRRISDQAPDNCTGKSRSSGFEHCEVTDAALIQAALIVDDQHVSCLGSFESLEKHVYAAAVPRG